MSNHHTPIKPSEDQLAYLKQFKIDTVQGKVFNDYGEIGHLNTHGYYVISGKRIEGTRNRKKHLRHHVIWWAYYGEWPTNLLDHDNGNTTCDAISNLILSSTRDNPANSPRKRAGGLPTGVVKASHSKNYEARIVVKSPKGHRAVYLGTYTSPEQAGEAYQKAKGRINQGLSPRT